MGLSSHPVLDGTRRVRHRASTVDARPGHSRATRRNRHRRNHAAHRAAENENQLPVIASEIRMDYALWKPTFSPGQRPSNSAQGFDASRRGDLQMGPGRARGCGTEGATRDALANPPATDVWPTISLRHTLGHAGTTCQSGAMGVYGRMVAHCFPFRGSAERYPCGSLTHIDTHKHPFPAIGCGQNVPTGWGGDVSASCSDVWKADEAGGYSAGT